jgi:hypothetical protein
MTERKHPSQWTPVKFADVGTSEEFVRQMLEMFELLKGTMIPDQQQEVVRDAFGDILTNGLTPAFLELRSIWSSVGADLPLVDKLQLYEDFARKLWKSYKDLLQRAAAAMGFEIGFLFQNEKNFEAGLKTFRGANPMLIETFEEYLRATRKNWQNDLAKFRNGFLEHQEGARIDFVKYYDPPTAEALFNLVSRTIVDFLVCLMNLRLRAGVHIVEYDPNIHGPGWPDRFRWNIDFPLGHK